MAIPNLRFNKGLTRKLIKSSPKEKLNSNTIKWHLENDDKLYGSFADNIFGTTLFFIQYDGVDRYRLIVAKSNGFLGIYLIDDIDSYLEYIGAERLEMTDDESVSGAIDAALTLPNTGIIKISDEKIYVYDHTNY